jgi:hypothetical protein
MEYTTRQTYEHPYMPKYYHLQLDLTIKWWFREWSKAIDSDLYKFVINSLRRRRISFLYILPIRFLLDYWRYTADPQLFSIWSSVVNGH